MEAVRLYNKLSPHRDYLYHMGLWEMAEILDATLEDCIMKIE